MHTSLQERGQLCPLGTWLLCRIYHLSWNKAWFVFISQGLFLSTWRGKHINGEPKTLSSKRDPTYFLTSAEVMQGQDDVYIKKKRTLSPWTVRKMIVKLLLHSIKFARNKKIWITWKAQVCLITALYCKLCWDGCPNLFWFSFLSFFCFTVEFSSPSRLNFFNFLRIRGWQKCAL